jgi:multiple sugar transport system permease protein
VASFDIFSGFRSQSGFAHRMARYTLNSRTILGMQLTLAGVISLFFLYPFIFSILSSFKGPTEVYLFPPTLFPKVFIWKNYSRVWELAPFSRFYINTIIVTLLATLGSIISCTLVAYGFARFQFPGRNMLFILIIGTLILPEEVTLVPRFILFKQLDWLDSFLPLTVPYFFAANGFFIFLLRQFIMGIPRELDEAAEMDGANSLRVLVNVILPLLTPALATVAIFAFLYNWNDFIHPLIYLRSTETFTLSLGLRFFQNTGDIGGEPREAYLMAASLLASIPPILVFIFSQRYYIRGVIFSGMKR